MNDAVVNDQDSASQTTDGDLGAPEKTLDDVLSEIDKEFDKDLQAPDEKQDTEDNTELTDLKNTVDHLMSQTTNQDIDRAVEEISSSIEANVPKRAIRGMLNDMAVTDPRLRKAFDNRHSDAATWNKVLKAASKSIQKEFAGLPDKSLTDDRDAVSAAIQGASKTIVDDEAPNFSKMTDAEFEEYKLTH